MLIGSHAFPGVDIPLEQRLLRNLEYANGRRASTLRDTRVPLPEQGLLADGETVLNVPAKLSARVRVFDAGQRRKTEPVDAHSVAMGPRPGRCRAAPASVTARPSDRA
jgi:hypothetical protein